MNDSKVKLILRADVTLENKLSDALLTYEKKLPFQLVSVKSFHADAQLISIQDQVSGYRPEILVHIDMNKIDVKEVLSYLSQTLPGVKVKYNVLPVLEMGEL